MATSTEVLPVIEDGSGQETLFFVHGWPDDAHLWDGQVAHFRDRFRCLRVTMPHFAGHALATKLEHRPQGYDFAELGRMLANTIRKESRGKPLTLVIHDWGCFWGFIAQLHCPELVRAVVAMDVGHPSGIVAGARSLPMVIAAGLAYQYFLATMYAIARGSRGTPLEAAGRSLADGAVRALVRLFTAELGVQAPDTTDERITANACYPYWFFQTGPGVRGIAAWDGKSPTPTCPCLYFYGTRKPFSFHSPAWERHLRSRLDCRVVPIDAGHWVQLQQASEVNRIMDEWLRGALRSGPASRL